MSMARQGLGVKLIEKPEQVEAALWRRFTDTQELCYRHALFSRYRVLALKIANKEFGRRPAYGLESNDFQQFAYAGLLEAIDRYNPEKGVPFTAFAKYRIVGSINDGLSLSSESGAEYSFRRKVERARLNSLNLNDDNENALEKLSKLAVGLAIGFIIEGGEQVDNVPDATPNAYETLSWFELRSKLNSEVMKLPKKENTVIKEHYINGVTFIQIAKLLCLTKGRVSQLHRQAVERLRLKMKSFF